MTGIFYELLQQHGGGTDTKITVSTESWPWRRKFSHRFCRDLNPRPFALFPWVPVLTAPHSPYGRSDTSLEQAGSKAIPSDPPYQTCPTPGWPMWCPQLEPLPWLRTERAGCTSLTVLSLWSKAERKKNKTKKLWSKAEKKKYTVDQITQTLISKQNHGNWWQNALSGPDPFFPSGHHASCYKMLIFNVANAVPLKKCTEVLLLKELAFSDLNWK